MRLHLPSLRLPSVSTTITHSIIFFYISSNILLFSISSTIFFSISSTISFSPYPPPSLYSLYPPPSPSSPYPHHLFLLSILRRLLFLSYPPPNASSLYPSSPHPSLPLFPSVLNHIQIIHILHHLLLYISSTIFPSLIPHPIPLLSLL